MGIKETRCVNDHTVMAVGDRLFGGPFSRTADENVDHASRHGIKFWGIERLTTDIMIGRIGVQQFKTVRPLLWNQGVSAAILDRRGLPFAFHKLGQRVFSSLGW